MKCFDDDCLQQAVPPGNYCGKHRDKSTWIPAMRRIEPTESGTRPIVQNDEDEDADEPE